jgi:diadenosine tetraphosphate (Ap4A) HIT family hydrolase
MDSRQATVLAHLDESDCEFCSPYGRLEWFNKPVAVDEGHSLALPSLGSFMPGYLLALPLTHVTASCRIPLNDKTRFATFVHKLVSQMADLYRTPITIYEHGACSAGQSPQSACVNHAHVHLVPGSYDLSTEASAQVCKYASFIEFLEEERNDPYLMLQDPGGPVLSFEDQPTSQFFRRIVAQRLGIADCWDYAMFPFFENIKRTYQDFGIDAL